MQTITGPLYIYIYISYYRIFQFNLTIVVGRRSIDIIFRFPDESIRPFFHIIYDPNVNNNVIYRVGGGGEIQNRPNDGGFPFYSSREFAVRNIQFERIVYKRM